ncbi:MAG: hypothetical protein Rpha_1802 [Candidatus Ruthia sp. Apha_13_S6]|nr:hypothetical protein [Candidatus Ruthia sp. Apha_13_S6]
MCCACVYNDGALEGDYWMNCTQTPICPFYSYQDMDALENQEQSAFQCAYCSNEYSARNNNGIVIYTHDTTVACFLPYVRCA